MVKTEVCIYKLDVKALSLGSDCLVSEEVMLESARRCRETME